MPGGRMHKGRVKDIFVRGAKGWAPVAIRNCSRFVLVFLLGLAVNSSLSLSIEMSGGIALHSSVEYDCHGSRFSATAAEGARPEAADTSRTICWRRPRLA